MRISVAVLLALALVGAAWGAIPGPRIDQAVRAAFKKKGPGAVVAVMRDGEILHLATAGYADVEQRVPFTADTRFDLASVSKAFTAMAVLTLVDRGKLALDTDVRTILPELDRKKYREPVPLESVLGMTAGLPDYAEQFDDLTAVTNDQLAQAVGRVEPVAKVGAQYAYSNTAYALLALIIQRVSGEPYPKYMKEHIFDRLGMSATVVMDRAGMDIPGRAVGYTSTKKGAKQSRYDTAIVGDGQIITTANDMARWEKSLRAGGLVSAKLSDRAFRSGKTGDGAKTGYGFGWDTTGRRKERTLEHSGGWNGTATFFRIHLDGLSVLVMSNDDRADASGLADQVDQILGSEE